MPEEVTKRSPGRPPKGAISKEESKVEGVIDTAANAAEDVALKDGEAAIEAAVPMAAPLVSDVAPAIEKRVFAISNAITHDFTEKLGNFLVEIVAEGTEKLHETEIKALLEARILEETGVRLLNNALTYIEVTKAIHLA
jgi:hypothetical protein